MKKLKKLVLNELRQKNYILSSVEQQAIQGGGSGTAQDPYTMYEFENWNGPWNGGFVDGFGFVSSDAFVYGNRVSCYTYEDHFIRYDMVEGSGFSASFTSKVSTAISGGMLNIGASVKTGNPNYSYQSKADILVDGHVVSTIFLTLQGGSIYDPTAIPTGCASINLMNYHGHVQVEITTVGSIGSSADEWHSNVGGTQIVYDQNR